MKETASNTYETTRVVIDTRLARIAELLQDLDQRQVQAPRDWGFAGTAGHINSALGDIIESLGGGKQS